MKGVVFTEFLDMVESIYGYKVVDQIIEESNLESNGIYTSIGTYHHSEIVQLLSSLSSKVDVDIELLLKTFGEYLFDVFLNSYPQFFAEVSTSFDFLRSVDGHIHKEVIKLYPDATLPRFESEIDDEGNLVMIYMSERKMASLAEGLMNRSFAHYKEEFDVSKELLKEDGSEVRFTIKPI